MSAAATPEPIRKTGRGARTFRWFAACLLLLLIPLASYPSCAEARQRGEADDRFGGLILDDGEAYTEAVRLGTDIQVVVNGPIVRATVTQAFRNQTENWVEATYAYPLTEGAAVDTLKMVVGDRVIVGEIHGREEAREIYETARAAGQRAGLVELQRPNLFTNKVANIGPGETVLIQIEYQARVDVDGDTHSMRIPLVVAPRYAPMLPKLPGFTPDAPRIVSPVVDPRAGSINPVSIRVRLQPGFELGQVRSATHRIDQADESGARIVTLRDGDVPADRDFVLSWSAAEANLPQTSLFTETVDGQDYILAYITPPDTPARNEAPPREIIFVIDNSGSMSGESIRQARRSVAYGLSQLKPGDRFNVIRFDDTFTRLFPQAVDASRENIGRADRYVSGLNADGGTEMIPAMAAALEDREPKDGRIRQVVFITDGAIGNEQGLFDTIAARKGRSRIFMVGIGSAPNSYLMTRAAELGRGTFTHIGSTDAVDSAMRDLFDKLEAPVATDLVVELAGGRDVTPEVLPDLYRGEPLVMAARVQDMSGTFRVTGRLGGRPWAAEMDLSTATRAEGVTRLWARRMIADAEVARTLGDITNYEADAAILDLGLTHSIVTRMTSLVAVDHTPARPEGETLRMRDLPINLPAGWDFDALFGAQIDRAKHTQLALADKTADEIDLPRTSTSSSLLMLIGLILSALGVFLLARRRANSGAGA